MIKNLSAGNNSVHLRNYLRILYKRIWTVFAFFLVLVTTVTIGSFLQKPVYRATTQILIEKESRNINFQEAIGIETTDQDYYQTQYALLKSKSLIGKLIRSLNFSFNQSAESDLIERLLKSIYVQPIRNTRLVNLSVESTDPRLAGNMANTLAKLYVEQNLESRLFGSREILKKIREKGLYSLNQENRELIDSLPSVVNNSLIQRLKADYAAFETQYAEYRKRYTLKHPKMIRLRAEIEAMRGRIDQEIQRIVSSVKTELSGTLQANNIRVIDLAEIPRAPVRPNKKLNIILSIFLGLVLGSGLAFFLEYFDDTVKSSEDIEQSLELPFLGSVPRPYRKSNELQSVDLISFNQPKSNFSEAFRTIRTKVMLSLSDQRLKTILITSAAPQEGKTTNTINLGITFAQSGERILLVDSDMRHPRLSQAFKTEKNLAGLSNLLASPRIITGSDLENTVCSTEIPNLFVLSCGPIPPNPAELLNSKKMSLLIQLMGEFFDRIVFDSPPLNILADSIILSNLVDGVVLVIQANRTTGEMVSLAKSKLGGVKAKLLGTILNNVVKSAAGYYYYSYYYYGDDQRHQKKSKAHLDTVETVKEEILSQ